MLDSVQKTDFTNAHEETLLEIKGQVRDIWNSLNGKDGKLGVTQKVAVMWAMHIWVALATGGLMGSVSTAMVLKAFGLLK